MNLVGLCKTYGIFLAIAPTAGAVAQEYNIKTLFSKPELLRNTNTKMAYRFIKIREFVPIRKLEQITMHEVHKTEIRWREICTHCAARSGKIRRSDRTYPRVWRGMPNIDHIFLSLLFPNSSYFSALSLTVSSNVDILFPIFMRHDFPGNATLFFMPLAETDGNYFMTCSSVLDVGGFSLNGLVSAYDKFTWLCIFISLFFVPVLLSFILPRRLSDIVLNSLSVLLEQGCFGKFSRLSRWTSGVWLVAGIILSNT